MGCPPYLWQQQGADDGQGGLEVVLEPEPHGVDAAPDVDGAKQLQALGKSGERIQNSRCAPRNGAVRGVLSGTASDWGFLAQKYLGGEEIFVLTLPKEVLEPRSRGCWG